MLRGGKRKRNTRHKVLMRGEIFMKELPERGRYPRREICPWGGVRWGR